MEEDAPAPGAAFELELAITSPAMLKTSMAPASETTSKTLLVTVLLVLYFD
jgi:hypothetical protein